MTPQPLKECFLELKSPTKPATGKVLSSSLRGQMPHDGKTQYGLKNAHVRPAIY